MQGKKPRRVNMAAVLFGRRVHHFRLERGLTLDALAAMADVHRLTIIGVEHGRSEPNLITAFKLADALNFRFDDLSKSVI